MRQLTARARARIKTFIEQNAWVPLAGKAAGIAASLLILAAIGAGTFDGAVDLGPARAEAATYRRGTRTNESHPGTRGAPSAASSSAAGSSSSSSPSSSAASSADPGSAPSPRGSASASAKAPAAPAPVILNEATAAQLETLPGVGPAKAVAILALREKLGGRFKRFEDLLRVRGIKRKALLKIREHAVLDPPPPDAPPAGPTPSGSVSSGGVAPSPPKAAPAAAPRSW